MKPAEERPWDDLLDTAITVFEIIGNCIMGLVKKLWR